MKAYRLFYQSKICQQSPEMDIRHNGQCFIDPTTRTIFKAWMEGYKTGRKELGKTVKLLLKHTPVTWNSPRSEQHPPASEILWILLSNAQMLPCHYVCKEDGSKGRFLSIVDNSQIPRTSPEVLGWISQEAFLDSLENGPTDALFFTGFKAV